MKSARHSLLNGKFPLASLRRDYIDDTPPITASSKNTFVVPSQRSKRGTPCPRTICQLFILAATTLTVSTTLANDLSQAYEKAYFLETAKGLRMFFSNEKLTALYVTDNSILSKLQRY